jgi:hypothetical protein
MADGTSLPGRFVTSPGTGPCAGVKGAGWGGPGNLEYLRLGWVFRHGSVLRIHLRRPRGVLRVKSQPKPGRMEQP